VNNAMLSGALVVAAAGNSGNNGAISPANCNGALAVGASSGSGTSAARANFSNYGPNVAIAAPGTSIFSTFVPNTSSYKVLQGTSMATPFVSAAAALVYQKCGTATPSATVRSRLVDNEGPVVPSMFPQSVSVVAQSGTFTLTVNSETTGPLAADVAPADVQVALEALPSVGAGNVVVGGGPASTAPFSITFKGAGATNDPITVDQSLLVAGVEVTGPVSGSGTLTQTATMFAGGGTYTYTFAGAETTSPIPYDASAAAVRAALEALSGVGAGNVTVTLNTSGARPVYTIVFSNAPASNPTNEVVADAAALTPLATSTPAGVFPGRLDAGAALTPAC
jgi:subtilisin family serine protease